MGGKNRCVGHKESSGRAPEPAGDVHYLPIELWTGILIRTPAEDLLRFKGVCKAWYELIRSRSFAESHLEHWRSRPISRILFDVHSPMSDIFYSSNVYHKGDIISRLRSRLGYHRICRCHSLLTSPQRAKLGCVSKELKILASCDGLILICSYAEGTHNYQLLICNPVTGSYRKLPVFQPTSTRFWSNCEWAVLRTASAQYKVCGIEKTGSRERERERERKCYILELLVGTKEQPELQWKELMAPPSGEWSIQATTTKDGKVHWLATKWRFADMYYTLKVVSLDILKEKFSASVSVESRLCEMKGHFTPWQGAFFYRTRHREDKSCSLWVLEDIDTMTWTECGNFRLIDQDPNFLRFSTVIGDNKLLLGYYDYIYVFDLISKEFWRLSIDTGPLGLINVLHTDSLIGCS